MSTLGPLRDFLPQEWHEHPAAYDVSGRPTQRRVEGDCANCGAHVVGYVWSLSGSGKRCHCCNALLTMGSCFLDEKTKKVTS